MRRLATISALALLILGTLAAPLHAQAQRKKYDTGWWWTFGSGGGGGGSPAVAQTFHCQASGGAGSTCTATSGSNITNGDVLAAYTSNLNTNGSTAVTPAGCVTWTKRGSTDATGETWYSGPVTSTGPCSVTNTTAFVVTAMEVFELKNIINSVDGTPLTQWNTGVANPVTGPALTTTMANGDLVLGACLGNTAVGGLTINAGLSSLFSGGVGTYFGVQGSTIQASAGAVTPTPSYNGTNSFQAFGCGIIAFQP